MKDLTSATRKCTCFEYQSTFRSCPPTRTKTMRKSRTKTVVNDDDDAQQQGDDNDESKSSAIMEDDDEYDFDPEDENYYDDSHAHHAATIHRNSNQTFVTMQQQHQPEDFTQKTCLGSSSADPKMISHIQFGMLSAAEIQRMAEFQVTSLDLYSLHAAAVAATPADTSATPVATVALRQPATNGCLDPRLGVSSEKFGVVCHTCGLGLRECAGHYGYIRLALPVFHIGFLRHTIHILQCICKSCSRLLLPTATHSGDDPVRSKYLTRMRNPKNDVLQKQSWLKALIATCKKTRICSYCGAFNGTVKRISGAPTLKIVHEKYKGAGTSSRSAAGGGSSNAALMQEGYEALLKTLETAMANNPVVSAAFGGEHAGATVPTFYEDLLPTRVLELFQNIPDDDCEIMWLDPVLGRPENLILQNLLVPPVPIRPSVAMDGTAGNTNEDDLTIKLQEILDVNTSLQLALLKGPPTRTVYEAWDFLHVHVAQYINGDMPGLQRPMGGAGSSHFKAIRGLCQRLKGKQGRFRGNLSGKRVDFSARTVISPDPNLSVNVVRAKQLPKY
jgi:DNA-directed RNA polymerase III subunit RPC1